MRPKSGTTPSSSSSIGASVLGLSPAAADFGAGLMAPLSDVRLPDGWFEGPCGGRLLPQPELVGADGPVLLDALLGAGFTALLRGSPEPPPGLGSHPLWRALQPDEVYLEGAVGEALADFIELDRPGITLLRPDRFVLADIAPEDTAALDALWDQLQRGRAA